MSLWIRLPRRALARPLVAAVALVGSAFMAPAPRPARAAEADKADPATQAEVAEPREITNPYHPRPVWRLWARDPGPVTLTIDNEQKTFAPSASAGGAAIRLAEPGRHELRVGVFPPGSAAASVVVAAVVTVDPPAAGK